MFYKKEESRPSDRQQGLGYAKPGDLSEEEAIPKL